jgi:hypothetical protein
VVWVLMLLLIALLPASIARHKGRSFFTWYVGGILLWIVAFPASIMVSDRRRRCPHCAEIIQQEASVCPHCQRPAVPSAGTRATG